MSGLEVFTYSGQQVRTVLLDGDPWFVGADVCAVLGYSNSRDAISKHVPESQRRVSRFATPSGEQGLTVISEAGLYRLIMRSNVAGAEPFQDWVTTEVLPQIRRTGSYGVPQLDPMNNVDHLALIVRAGSAALDRALTAEAKVAELEPAAEAWDALASAEGDYSLREAAEVLSRDGRIDTGQNRLLKYLREIGWVDRKGTPYQTQIGNGRLAVRTRTYDDPYTGEPKITTQIRVTPKGVDALYKLLTQPAEPGLRSIPGGAA